MNEENFLLDRCHYFDTSYVTLRATYVTSGVTYGTSGGLM